MMYYESNGGRKSARSKFYLMHGPVTPGQIYHVEVYDAKKANDRETTVTFGLCARAIRPFELKSTWSAVDNECML